MGQIFRTLFFIVIAYYVWKLIDTAFFQGKNQGQNRNNTNTRRNSQPDITTRSTDKSIIPDDEGDYIDYKEVK